MAQARRALNILSQTWKAACCLSTSAWPVARDSASAGWSPTLVLGFGPKKILRRKKISEWLYRYLRTLIVQCTCISLVCMYLADPWTRQIHFPSLHQHQYLTKKELEIFNLHVAISCPLQTQWLQLLCLDTNEQHKYVHVHTQAHSNISHCQWCRMHKVYSVMDKIVLTFLRRLWTWSGGGRGGACRGLRATTAGPSINYKQMCKKHISYIRTCTLYI